MSPLTGVLSEAWDLYRRFASHFLLIAFVIYVVTALLVALLSLAGVVGAILGAILAFAATYVVQASLIKAVQDVRDGRVDLDLSQTVQAAAPYILPVIGAAILAGIGITIGFILLIVPGLILLTFWSLIVPFIVVGGSKALESFGNSWRTVRGYAWRVFGTYVLVWLILIAFGIVLGLILAALPTFWRNFLDNLVSGTLVAPFLALVATLIYYRLTAAHANQPYTATGPSGATVWEPPYPTTPGDTSSGTAATPPPPPAAPPASSEPPGASGPPRPTTPGPRDSTPPYSTPPEPPHPAPPPRRSRPHHLQAPRNLRGPPTQVDARVTASGSRSGLQLAFVDVHNGTVFSRPVGETEALIQPAGGQVRLVDTDVHGVGASAAGLTQRRFHERPPQALPPAGRGDIQLREVTLQASAPDGSAEAEHGQAVWPVSGQQDQRVAALKE